MIRGLDRVFARATRYRGMEFAASVWADMQEEGMSSGTESKTRSAYQACAVPFRWGPEGLEFCLITTSQGNWSFPKGTVDAGETYQEAALKEAFEEAGLHGRLIGEPLGSYRLSKYGKTFDVIATLMQVTQCDANWQEEQIRQRRWTTAQKTAQLLTQKPLKGVFDEALRRLQS
jgi:8-oxo-dGTP pyrophosphatase MutT (NUDIX family)